MNADDVKAEVGRLLDMTAWSQRYGHDDLVTPRQLRVLAMICALRAAGKPVTVRGLMRRLGIGNPNGVKFHLTALRRKGLLTWELGRSGTIMPTVRMEAVR